MSENFERLVLDYLESLQREMKEGFADLRNRLDTQAIRMDRQGALIQNGSRWVNRMNGWSERVDQALEKRDKEISDLRERVARLEAKLDQPRPGISPQ